MRKKLYQRGNVKAPVKPSSGPSTHAQTVTGFDILDLVNGSVIRTNIDTRLDPGIYYQEVAYRVNEAQFDQRKDRLLACTETIGAFQNALTSRMSAVASADLPEKALEFINFVDFDPYGIGSQSSYMDFICRSIAVVHPAMIDIYDGVVADLKTTNIDGNQLESIFGMKCERVGKCLLGHARYDAYDQSRRPSNQAGPNIQDWQDVWHWSFPMQLEIFTTIWKIAASLRGASTAAAPEKTAHIPVFSVHGESASSPGKEQTRIVFSIAN